MLKWILESCQKRYLDIMKHYLLRNGFLSKLSENKAETNTHFKTYFSVTLKKNRKSVECIKGRNK